MADPWQARFERERRARKEAERLLDEKSREVYERNHELVALAQSLEAQVRQRTVDLERALAKERELVQQQRNFISVVSHEFRTPLAVIDGAAQRLVRSWPGDEHADIHERAGRIRNAVAGMTELIEVLLGAGQMDSIGIALRREQIDLRDVVRTAWQRQMSIAPRHRISLTLPDEPLTVDGDARRLDQVFSNLLSNAVKYAGEKQIVEIEAAVAGGFVSVRVRDYGIGIPAAELPNLFRRFFRASTAAGIQGSGVGLHFINHLVEIHGGAITVESEVGKGSCFTVSLPQALGARGCDAETETAPSA